MSTNNDLQGGAVGLGNMLRYPSVVYANNGLQWFIPYLIALFFLGIPVLLLEIAIGQAYRGGSVTAFHGLNRRTKGIGLGVIMNGYVVATYYVPIIAWIMVYFRSSFISPLPWKGRGMEFYLGDVIANPEPVGGETDGSKVVSYMTYPGTGLVGETVGWTAFVWFLVYLCMYKGVGVTGRAVYITMGLPLIMLFVLIGRGVSLPNAVDGIRMYMGVWNGEKLADGAIWQGAVGQIFFSIGVGFGYFTSYASYNSKYANAVQDALIIAFSNSLYEVVGAFSVFGVIGFLGYKAGDPDVSLSTFTVGFLTYPLALAEMPGANVWSVLFFLTILMLGLSSAFALVESIVTMICDTAWGQRTNRVWISTPVVFVSFLLSLMYCTEFGFYLLDAVDTWTNNLALMFVVWIECVAVTSVYRHVDVHNQVGWVSFLMYNICYTLAMVLGVAVAHAAGASAGAGVGFGIFIIGTIVSVIMAKTPDSVPPSFWGKNALLSKFWWLAFYSVRIYLVSKLRITLTTFIQCRVTNFAETLTTLSLPERTGRFHTFGVQCLNISQRRFSLSLLLLPTRLSTNKSAPILPRSLLSPWLTSLWS
jgi:solute carrier family 6 GABA transporter-like protein 1